MTMTAAERQAAYRKRRAFEGKNGNGECRLNTWVSTGASLALARLARHHKIAQRDMVERLLLAADENILATLAIDTPEWETYFGR